MKVEKLNYKPKYLQILNEQSQINPDIKIDFSPDFLIKLYESMFFARKADERKLKLQRQGRIGTFAPATGQEAPACGAALAMGPRDWLVSTYRELGARLIRGDKLENLLMYSGGYEEGSAVPKEHRILPMQVILGSQTLHAVGIAYAMKYLGEKDTAVVCFFGDGASSQGDVHEAMNFAGVWKVPIVFICQNNGWAISTPRKIQTAAETIAQRAIGYGFEGLQVDGNDPLAMYVATKEALEKAKSKNEPTLIEAMTYRLLMHTTADDPKRYRDPKEEEEWWKKDPIPRLRKYMESLKIWDDNKEKELEERIKTKIDESVKIFESKTDYAPDAPFEYLFETKHYTLEEQRQKFLQDYKADEEEGLWQN